MIGPNPAREHAVLGIRHTIPSFEMPEGACDCHVHVFGPTAQYPMSSTRPYTPREARVDDLMAHQMRLRLSRVVIVQPSVYGSDNRCTLDAIHQIGRAARGVAVVEPTTPRSELHEMHELGIRGVRLNFGAQANTSISEAKLALKLAAEQIFDLGWHVQTFTDLSIIAALHDTIMGLPVPLVIDHFGRASAAAGINQPGFEALLSLVASGRAYVKLSAPYLISNRANCSDVGSLARALINANSSRILWGSDWPHPAGGTGGVQPIEAVHAFRPIDDGEALGRLKAWALDGNELKQILVDNPAQLYGFGA